MAAAPLFQTFTIEPISVTPRRLPEVIALWRENSRTLGFFPEGAFVEFASRGRILVASTHSSFAGYLAFRVSGDRAVIVHLCTMQAARGTGAARALVNELKTTSRHRELRGIGLSCRADYDANNFWPKIGFCPVHERAGRSKDGKMLTYWWHDHGLPDLFSLANTDASAARVRAAIDANIYYDLISDRTQGEESRALIADWLQSELELCITDEIYQEISRGKDEEDRRRCRERLGICRLLTSTEEQQAEPQRQILALLGEGKSDDDKSDRAHLIRAAAAKAQVFLTRDDDLITQAEEIHRLIGVELMRHSDMKLRMGIYADVAQLPIIQESARLPPFTIPERDQADGRRSRVIRAPTVATAVKNDVPR